MEGMRRKNTRKGFTLVELIVVLSILAILATLLIPALTEYIEKAKRTEDFANARSAVQALRVGMSSGDIEFTQESFEGNPTCAVIVVGREEMKCFVSGSVKIEGVSYDTDQVGHSRLEEYLKTYEISNMRVKARRASENEGWKFYAVFLYNDGTIRIASGSDSGFDDYREDTFEKHALYWKTAKVSNMEKAIGWH